ncbi:hypothetical protein VULLAG_LOCUS2638 [Vulpes lagopus]
MTSGTAAVVEEGLSSISALAASAGSHSPHASLEAVFCPYCPWQGASHPLLLLTRPPESLRSRGSWESCGATALFRIPKFSVDRWTDQPFPFSDYKSNTCLLQKKKNVEKYEEGTQITCNPMQFWCLSFQSPGVMEQTSCVARNPHPGVVRTGLISGSSITT